MTTPHPDTPELDKILEKFWADTRYTKEVKRAGNFTETKAALTRLLAKRELEGRIDEVAKAISHDTNRSMVVPRTDAPMKSTKQYLRDTLAELREELAKYE
jgi:hypothetical protein